MPPNARQQFVALRGIPENSPGMNDHERYFRRALELATPDSPPPVRHYSRTKERTLTRRGLIWLGQTCNLRCHFCYFLDRIENPEHPEHRFMSLEKAKQICSTLVETYDNNAIDIQGGEPTLFPGILDLVRHCRQIGLFATIITNAQRLADHEYAAAFKAAGIRDFLVSIQGLGPVYDTIVARSGAHEKQMLALRNLQQLNIPFRFNVVMSKLATPQLPFISRLAVKTGAKVVNFLAFNPYDDQRNGGKRSDQNVPRYSELRAPLTEALAVLAHHDVEANVRYLPLCGLPADRLPNMYNFQQLSYDHHENEFGGWRWTQMTEQRTRDDALTEPPLLGAKISAGLLGKVARKVFRILRKEALFSKWSVCVDNAMIRLRRRLRAASGRHVDYRNDARIRAHKDLGYVFASACSRCDLKPICDGFHGDYAAFFGTQEAAPVELGHPVREPRHFIQRQVKIVQDEDIHWAIAQDRDGS